MYVGFDMIVLKTFSHYTFVKNYTEGFYMSDDFELTTYTEDECKNKIKCCSKKNTSTKNTSSKKLKRCPKTIDFVEELCGDKYRKTKKGEGY